MKLRFSSRDLLWLTLVAALIAGWWSSDRRKNEQLKAEKAATKAHAENHAKLLRALKKSREPRLFPLAQLY